MLIIANKPGQLGNRLIIFARMIAYACEHHLKVINPAFDEYAHLFENTYASTLCGFPQRQSSLSALSFMRGIAFKLHYYIARIIDNLKLRNAFLACIYLDWDEKIDLDYESLPHATFVWLQGWGFRGKEIVKKHQDQIRNYFEPTKEHVFNINEYYKTNIGSADQLVIGVHIRQGDYEHFEGGKYFYTIDKYLSFLDQLKVLFFNRNIKFVICSNVNHNSSVFKNFDVVMGPGHIIEDMYLLAKCDYIIGPPSTYTMWASFYGKVPLLHVKTSTQVIMSISDFEICEL